MTCLTMTLASVLQIFLAVPSQFGPFPIDSVGHKALAASLDCKQVTYMTINWEFQGFWFHHGVSNSDGSERYTPAEFIGSFRRLAGILKGACPSVPIVWGLANILNNWLPAGRTWSDYYPGDDLVDAIGMDLYEQNFYSSGPVENSFNTIYTQSGLDLMYDFAMAHNKKIALPEWAASYDDGPFVQGVSAWICQLIQQDRFIGFTYWDSTVAVVPSTALYNSPSAQAAFVASWSKAGCSKANSGN